MSKVGDIVVTDIPMTERTDDTMRPQDDYFAYANNKWLAANPIPDTEARWGAFHVLREQSLQNLRKICEDLVKKSDLKAGSPEQQVRDFYLSGINYDAHQAENLKVLTSLLQKIDKATDTSQLIGELHRIGMGSPWSVMLDADDKNSARHMLRLRQGGLTLPERDYYLSTSAKMRSVRKKYEAYVKKSHDLMPDLAPSAEKLWSAVWDTELKLAEISRTSVALREVEANYNPHSFKQLEAKYPAINWKSYAKALHWQKGDNITVDQPEFFDRINTLLSSGDIQQLKTYLKWKVFSVFSQRVSEQFAKHRFDFFGKVIAGTKQMPPLWKRVISMLDNSIGETLGQLYVQEHFPESSKQQLRDMVEDIRGVYGERIMRLGWMSSKTKQYALKKLGNIKVLAGYPDKWRDFTALEITSDSFIGNIIQAEEFENDYDMQRLTEPTSRDEWFMNPQTVNAYHDPNRLVICFPAAILQPPFFDPSAHIAQNLGAIGSVIGHELTHGFDDQGCLFDAEGNVRTWQTAKEQAAFKERAKIIIEQADAFEVLPGLSLQGNLIIGESIADLGGVEIAFEALSKKGALDEPALGDITAEELFFLSNAACECGSTREELKRQYTLMDPHPDERFRINGTIQHSDDWHRIYRTTPDDALYRPPENRAKIW